jgi:hypothetical protein
MLQVGQRSKEDGEAFWKIERDCLAAQEPVPVGRGSALMAKNKQTKLTSSVATLQATVDQHKVQNSFLEHTLEENAFLRQENEQLKVLRDKTEKQLERQAQTIERLQQDKRNKLKHLDRLKYLLPGHACQTEEHKSHRSKATMVLKYQLAVGHKKCGRSGRQFRLPTTRSEQLVLRTAWPRNLRLARKFGRLQKQCFQEGYNGSAAYR